MKKIVQILWLGYMGIDMNRFPVDTQKAPQIDPTQKICTWNDLAIHHIGLSMGCVRPDTDKSGPKIPALCSGLSHMKQSTMVVQLGPDYHNNGTFSSLHIHNYSTSVMNHHHHQSLILSV